MNKQNLFINRELSWLDFNYRVLEEAKDKDNPLFERLKFLSIVSSNLDEFFMIRVASLKDQVNAGFNKPDPAGLTPKEQLKEISIKSQKMVQDQYNTFNKSLIPKLKEEKIEFINLESISPNQMAFLEEYFINFIYPVLTPLAVDSSRPFPLILNKSLNLGVFVKSKDLDEDREYTFATVQVPAVLPRLIELPSKEKRQFIFLEQVITLFIEKLFTGQKVICAFPYRIIRNADLTIEEEEAEDLLVEIEKSLKERKWGQAIKLEVHHKMDEKMVKLLKDELEIHHRDIYYINGPLDLTFLMKLYSLEGYENLKYPKYEPQIPQDLLGEEDAKDIFKLIKEKDIFLHHPYESFQPVIDFIKQASQDPKVLAIKQTLYRVSGDSPIVQALAEAAENGKQVTVLVEVKARFDEENNIQWAKRLERAGCHVIYGLVGLKTHCKITLVVRLEDEGIKRYVHLGTGNYNDVTAKLYTDMGLFTCNEYFGADASTIFNMLSGYSEITDLYKLTVAPNNLRDTFLQLIKNEEKNALKGQKAKIIAKMNSLVDTEIIESLYEASKAGVKIDLIVRGICCLKPEVPGLSENITVRSIVGRFLEHSRIFYFYNSGKEKVYLSSADWMPRNLNRRVETLFPIEDEKIKKRIINILLITLLDTIKARMMNSDGIYKKVEKRGKSLINSQVYFAELAQKMENKYKKEKLYPKHTLTSND